MPLRSSLPRFLAAAILSGIVVIGSGCGSSRTAVRSAPDGGRAPAAYGDLSDARIHVLREADAWTGTPYRSGGSDRDGTDCSGFVCAVFDRIGVTLPRTAHDMYTSGVAVARKRLRPGDLVFFRNTAGRGITHVGIYTGNGRFIHASTSKGVITSTLDEAYYARHYAGARAILR